MEEKFVSFLVPISLVARMPEESIRLKSSPEKGQVSGTCLPAAEDREPEPLETLLGTTSSYKRSFPCFFLDVLASA